MLYGSRRHCKTIFEESEASLIKYSVRVFPYLYPVFPDCGTQCGPWRIFYFCRKGRICNDDLAYKESGCAGDQSGVPYGSIWRRSDLVGTGDCGELLCGAGTGALLVVQEKRKMIKYFNWKYLHI